MCSVKMSTVVDVVSQLLFPESIERLVYPSRSNESSENRGSIPVDILDTQKEYIFYMDVPGLSKSDIQVGAVFNFVFLTVFTSL